MNLPMRPGMTVPLPGPLHSHRAKLAELADMGYTCLLYTSDAADERSSVDLGGRRIIKKKKNRLFNCDLSGTQQTEVK